MLIHTQELFLKWGAYTMGKRALHDVLCEVLGSPFPDGSDHCYFSPPNNTDIKYPCIVYNYNNDLNIFADNVRYQNFKNYNIIVIDHDQDSKIQTKLIKLPYCTLDRIFTVKGLVHFVHALYYNGPRIKEDDKNVQNKVGSNR